MSYDSPQLPCFSSTPNYSMGPFFYNRSLFDPTSRRTRIAASCQPLSSSDDQINSQHAPGRQTAETPQKHQKKLHSIGSQPPVKIVTTDMTQ